MKISVWIKQQQYDESIIEVLGSIQNETGEQIQWLSEQVSKLDLKFAKCQQEDTRQLES